MSTRVAVPVASSSSSPAIYAHRGAYADARHENTLGAFRDAAARGYGVECDVRLSADRVPVAVHDATLARTHGAPHRVDALTARELAGFGVPTVEEVLRALPDDTRVILDVKERDAVAPLAAACRDRPHRTLLLWGDDWPVPRGVRALRAHDYRFPCCSPRGVWGVACKFSGSAVNLGCIRRTLEAGRHVNVYTPDGRRAAAAARAVGGYPTLGSATVRVRPAAPRR